jgi:streptomycin 3"-adenylyltransferase
VSVTSTDIPPEESAQLERVHRVLRDSLGEALVGVYLFGSATSSGLKPRSDLDVMVVSCTPMTLDQKAHLISKLLGLSCDPRHLEVTIVIQSDVRPWRYPPRMELQYGDWWRKEFERGNLQPWEERNPDLASLISMVLDASTVLYGPPPDEVFDRVPRADYTKALHEGIGGLMVDLPSDTTNVVLTLARIWSGLATGGSRSKDAAADWVLPHLPAEHRPVLEEARAIYLGELQAEPSDFAVRAQAYAELVIKEIQDTESSST